MEARSYCYDIGLKAIYSGAPKSLLGSGETSGTVINNWSPNNIRRLVISADGVLVQRYVTTPRCPKLVEIVLFKDSRKYQECVDSDDYKPVSKALSALRVCSCVEEIIYLTGQNRFKQYISLDELQITKYHTSLKRLHSRVKIPMTLQEFAEVTKSKLNNPLYQVCDDKEIPNKQVEIKVEDWWKHYSLRPTYYSLDAENGKLDKYFKDVELKKETTFKNETLKEIENNRYRGKSEELEKINNSLEKMLKCLARFNSLSKKYTNNVDYLGDFSEPDKLYKLVVLRCNRFIQVAEVENLDEFSSVVKNFLEVLRISIVNGKEVSKSKAYDIAIDLLKTIYRYVYLVVTEYTLELCIVLSSKFPISAKVLVGFSERMLKVPSELESLSSAVRETCGIVDTGVQTMSSYYNCMVICSAILLPANIKFTKDDGESVLKFNKEYWSQLGGASNV